MVVAIEREQRSSLLGDGGSAMVVLKKAERERERGRRRDERGDETEKNIIFVFIISLQYHHKFMIVL